MPEFISKAFRIPKKDIATSYHTDTPFYAYEHEAEIRQLEPNYFPNGVVAHTDAVWNIAELSVEHMPYENGIHPRPAIRRHEFYHILIERAGGYHDEKGINSQVAYDLKLTQFPFPSY